MPDSDDQSNMYRRQFLGLGFALATAAIAGCTGMQSSAGVGTVPTASLRMQPVTHIEIAEEVTYDSSVEDHHPLDTDVITEGSMTVEATEPPFPENRPFVFDDSVYELSYEVTGSQPATSFRIILDPVEGAVEDSQTIQYQNLPSVDQEVFRNRGWDDIESLGFGTSILYLNNAVRDSVLVPDPEYSVIVWGRETRGRFSVEGSHETELKTYQYSSSVVNESAKKYGRRIEDKYGFGLTDLSSEQREIVSSAINNESGYVVPREETVSDAMTRLVDQFRAQKEIDWVWDREDTDGSISGRYLVRYRDEVYLTRLQVSQQSETTMAGNESETETGTNR